MLPHFALLLGPWLLSYP